METRGLRVGYIPLRGLKKAEEVMLKNRANAEIKVEKTEGIPEEQLNSVQAYGCYSQTAVFKLAFIIYKLCDHKQVT